MVKKLILLTFVVGFISCSEKFPPTTFIYSIENLTTDTLFLVATDTIKNVIRVDTIPSGNALRIGWNQEISGDPTHISYYNLEFDTLSYASRICLENSSGIELYSWKEFNAGPTSEDADKDCVIKEYPTTHLGACLYTYTGQEGYGRVYYTWYIEY